MNGASGEGVREATEGEGSQLNMTHAESLEVLVPKGTTIHRMITKRYLVYNIVCMVNVQYLLLSCSI